MTPPGRSKSRLTAVGVALVIAGLVAGVVFWVLADRRYDDAVRGLARAPVGCDTTLDFETTGAFLIFVETQGSIDEVPGSCESPTSWDFSGDAPTLSLTLLDGNDDVVDLAKSSGIDYEIDGFRGASIRSVEITDAGLYRLTVQADANEVGVAVGRDPADGTMMLRGLGIAAGIVGLGAGIVLMIVARRRRTPPGTSALGTTLPQPPWATPAPWQPVLGPPSAVAPMPPTVPPGGFAPGPPSGPPTTAVSSPTNSPWAPPGDRTN